MEFIFSTLETSQWDISTLKENKPKTQKEFRTIVSEYIKDKHNYANEYDKELLASFCRDTIKFKLSNTLPESNFKFEPNTVYLLRIDDGKGYEHYQAII